MDYRLTLGRQEVEPIHITAPNDENIPWALTFSKLRVSTFVPLESACPPQVSVKFLPGQGSGI